MGPSSAAGKAASALETSATQRLSTSSGTARRILASIVLCFGLIACSGSTAEQGVESSPPAILPTAQPLLPPAVPENATTDPAAAAASSTATVPGPTVDALLESSGAPALTDEEFRLYSSWQRNLAYERDLRNAAALVDIFFDVDGSLASTDTILADVRVYAAADPALLEIVEAVAGDVATLPEGRDVLVAELATRMFPDERDQPLPVSGGPRGDELRQLIAEGNTRLDPLKPTFFPLAHASIALASGQVNAPDGTAASLLVNELAAEAEAVYGVELAGPLDDLVQSIPAGAAFDSPEARRAFGRFVLELIERVGRPALGD